MGAAMDRLSDIATPRYVLVQEGALFYGFAIIMLLLTQPQSNGRHNVWTDEANKLELCT